MKFKRHGRHQGDSDVDPGPGHYIALDDWGAARREHDRTLYAFEKAALDEFRAANALAAAATYIATTAVVAAVTSFSILLVRVVARWGWRWRHETFCTVATSDASTAASATIFSTAITSSSLLLECLSLALWT